MSVSVPHIRLNNGHLMPQVGLGLWKVDKAACADQVYNAIKAGYRLFDGACDYGNEVEAGQGIARALKEGLVQRSELFLVSKLWNSFHDDERVEPIVKKQLGDWGIDYFDLYYVHFPISLKYVDPAVRYPPGWEDEEGVITRGSASIQETWLAMEALVKKGLARSIGISNFQGSLVLDLLRYAKVRPAALQIEHHPYLVQSDLITLAQKETIAVVAYSSFGPLSFRELEWKKALNASLLFEHDLIKTLAKKHGKTPAQVLLRWSTQRGLAVIPKSNHEGRLRQNLDVTTWDLEVEDLEAIAGLNRGLRFNNPPDTQENGNFHIFA